MIAWTSILSRISWMSICCTTSSTSIAATTTGATSLATDCRIAFASSRSEPNSPERDGGDALARRLFRAMCCGEPRERVDHTLDEYFRFLDRARVQPKSDVESIVDTESGDVDQRA